MAAEATNIFATLFTEFSCRTTGGPRRNLTLNLGLRYELTTARTTNNNQDVNFDLVNGKPQIGLATTLTKALPTSSHVWALHGSRNS